MLYVAVQRVEQGGCNVYACESWRAGKDVEFPVRLYVE